MGYGNIYFMVQLPFLVKLCQQCEKRGHADPDGLRTCVGLVLIPDITHFLQMFWKWAWVACGLFWGDGSSCSVSSVCCKLTNSQHVVRPAA